MQCKKQHYKTKTICLLLVFSNKIIIFAVLCRSVERVCEAHLCSIAPADKTALFEEMLQQWQANGNTLSDLTGPRFKPKTLHSRDKEVTARPTGIVVNNFQVTIFSHSQLINFRYFTYLAQKN